MSSKLEVVCKSSMASLAALSPAFPHSRPPAFLTARITRCVHSLSELLAAVRDPTLLTPATEQVHLDAKARVGDATLCAALQCSAASWACVEWLSETLGEGSTWTAGPSREPGSFVHTEPGRVLQPTVSNPGSVVSAVRAAFVAHDTIADTLQELAAELAKLCGKSKSDWPSAAKHNLALHLAFGHRLEQLQDTLRALRAETKVYRHYVEPTL